MCIRDSIYTDSRNAMLWVKNKRCKTTLVKNNRTAIVHQLIQRAEKWLKTNTYDNPILKWETKKWGEIPADFGRKWGQSAVFSSAVKQFNNLKFYQFWIILHLPNWKDCQNTAPIKYTFNGIKKWFLIPIILLKVYTDTKMNGKSKITFLCRVVYNIPSIWLTNCQTERLTN